MISNPQAASHQGEMSTSSGRSIRIQWKNVDGVGWYWQERHKRKWVGPFETSFKAYQDADSTK
jgi:hypothetical protein